MKQASGCSQSRLNLVTVCSWEYFPGVAIGYLRTTVQPGQQSQDISRQLCNLNNRSKISQDSCATWTIEPRYLKTAVQPGQQSQEILEQMYNLDNRAKISRDSYSLQSGQQSHFDSCATWTIEPRYLRNYATWTTEPFIGPMRVNEQILDLFQSRSAWTFFIWWHL